MDHEEEDSESEFEIPSDEELSSPDARKATKKRVSSTGPKGSQRSSKSILSTDEVHEDAAEWAAKFQVPLSPGNIRTPPRKPARARPATKKKSMKQPPNKVRAKRLKSFYSDEYRQLLNDTIQDAATEMLEEDQHPLEASQIGSSVWTSTEKDIFFSALARIGRDDIRGIADRIRTKSETEVHEYILLLHEGLRERRFKGAKVVEIFDLPAATEISEECCAVLERAGNAIAAREELATEKVDKGKWGDSWLLTKDVSRWIERRIKKEEGQEEMEEVLPAVNLLNLPNWLKLSAEVFMNPGGNHSEDNWENIAEPGETPSIRATAFQDFHSLTVSITKRLISTVLFCTISRLRARDSNMIKHAEVRPDDVEAAIKILGLKSDSIRFWTDCARRCHLTVIDDVKEDDRNVVDFTTRPDEVAMSYEDVETNLQTTTRLRSRSRSASQPPPATARSSIGIELPDPPISLSDYETPESESDIYSSSDEVFSSARKSRPNSPEAGGSPTGPRTTAALEDAHEAYAETLDTHHSRSEEVGLWNMLRQTAPFEIELEPITGLKRPKPVMDDPEDEDWRRKTEYWGQWETLPTPVSEEAFEKNRARLSRKGKRKLGVAFPETGGEEKGTEQGIGDLSHSLTEGEEYSYTPKRAKIPGSENGHGDEGEDEDESTEDDDVAKETMAEFQEDTTEDEYARHESAEFKGNDADDDMLENEPVGAEDVGYEGSDLQEDEDRMSEDQDDDVDGAAFAQWHAQDGASEDGNSQISGRGQQMLLDDEAPVAQRYDSPPMDWGSE